MEVYVKSALRTTKNKIMDKKVKTITTQKISLEKLNGQDLNALSDPF